LVRFGQPPVLPELVAVRLGPLDNQGQSAASQLAFYIERVDFDLCRIAALVNMKVRRRMIVEIHPDRDSVKLADRWHMSRV
jgi:hypothetical protein